MSDIWARFFNNTAGFRRPYFTLYNGEKLDMPPDLPSGFAHLVMKLLEKRGHDWIWKQFGRKNIHITFQSVIHNSPVINHAV